MERSDLDFIRDTLVAALNEKRDSIIGDLFKMYEEVQNRPTIPNLEGNINLSDYNFNLSSDYLDPKIESVNFDGVAAGPVNIPGAFGEDVISFGDYKSQEFRPE